MSNPTDDQWFSCNKWSYQPEEVEGEVTRFTDKCVWIGGRRHQRISEWRCYFPNINDAWIWLESLAREEIEAAHKKLDQSTSRLNQLRANRAGTEKVSG